MEHASILASSARSLAMHLTPEEIYADIRAHLAKRRSTRTASRCIRPHRCTAWRTPRSRAGSEAASALLAMAKFWSATGGVVMLSGVPLFLNESGHDRR